MLRYRWKWQGMFPKISFSVICNMVNIQCSKELICFIDSEPEHYTDCGWLLRGCIYVVIQGWFQTWGWVSFRSIAVFAELDCIQNFPLASIQYLRLKRGMTCLYGFLFDGRVKNFYPILSSSHTRPDQWGDLLSVSNNILDVKWL